MTTIEVILAIVSIVAIVVGPIAAVAITRVIDTRREVKLRKLDVFRTLMKTRRERLAYDHVSALNLVELEFYGEQAVQNAYRKYIEHLGMKAPPVGQDERFFKTRSETFADLLKEIGKSLGYSFDKMDLERLGYSPVGWERDQALTRNNASMINDILSGRRGFPVAPFNASPASPFPPPPEEPETE